MKMAGYVLIVAGLGLAGIGIAGSFIGDPSLVFGRSPALFFNMANIVLLAAILAKLSENK